MEEELIWKRRNENSNTPAKRCSLLLSFISRFYSFIWRNASEWILLESYTDCEAALRSTAASLPCCLLSVSLFPTPGVSFLLLIWSPFCSSYGIQPLQDTRKPTRSSSPPLEQTYFAGMVKVEILMCWVTCIALLQAELFSNCLSLPSRSCSYLFVV